MPPISLWASAVKTTPRFLASFALVLLATACTERTVPESSVFTLYSTNFPHEVGRYGVATFDLADETINDLGCKEAAELYRADFEKRKRENGWSAETKMRYWCEKGRFKK